MENHFCKYSLFQEEGFETSILINYWKRGKRTNQTKHTKTEQRFCLLLFNMALMFYNGKHVYKLNPSILGNMGKA